MIEGILFCLPVLVGKQLKTVEVMFKQFHNELSQN